MPKADSFAEILANNLNRNVTLRELADKLSASVWQERSGKKHLEEQRQLARQILQILNEQAEALATHE